MVHPNDIVLGGWDISAMPLDKAMERAQVLDVNLQEKMAPYMKDVVPLPGIFNPSFVAENQVERADNTLKGMSKADQVKKIRQDMLEFKAKTGVDKVIVLWTANTERYSEVGEFNSTKEKLLESIEKDHPEISPSTLYAVACIQEGIPFINGSPQNTFVPGCTELAVSLGSMIAGDDFKSGQTKMKSVLTDFLISAGIKPKSIVSYNHLGNNDGKNLTNPACFRSKEISKSDVVNDMINSNSILYSEEGEKPDHCVVIKYIPYVGDSKRAMDEYTSEIFMGGTNTIVMHNTCEDSLLAAPLILDLVLLAEITGRISFRKQKDTAGHNNLFSPALSDDTRVDTEVSPRLDDTDPVAAGYQPLHPVNVMLSYLTKAPFVPEGHPCINALNRQRAMLENVFKACVGLPPDNNMLLEFK